MLFPVSASDIEARTFFLLPVKMILQWPVKKGGVVIRSSHISPGATFSQVKVSPFPSEELFGTSCIVTDVIGDSPTFVAWQSTNWVSLPVNTPEVASTPACAGPPSTSARRGAHHHDRIVFIESSDSGPPLRSGTFRPEGVLTGLNNVQLPDAVLGTDATARLMAIAAHPSLANSDHGRTLPPTWTTLRCAAADRETLGVPGAV